MSGAALTPQDLKKVQDMFEKLTANMKNKSPRMKMAKPTNRGWFPLWVYTNTMTIDYLAWKYSNVPGPPGL